MRKKSKREFKKGDRVLVSDSSRTDMLYEVDMVDHDDESLPYLCACVTDGEADPADREWFRADQLKAALKPVTDKEMAEVYKLLGVKKP